MRTALALGIALLLVGSASANLINGDIENNSVEPYGGIDNWGPNGGNAPYANHGTPAPLPGTGDDFGYYSAQGTETVGQVSSLTFAADTLYEFSGLFTGGGSGFGEVVLQIGYADLETGDFLALSTLGITVDNTWAAYPGVTYNTGATGEELGQPIWVRLGDGIAGTPGDSDIWFDNLTLTPEPASLILLALGALVLRRR
ncbi:MAG: PEP-CTERM sorting domain-containing protein [Phycisphaerae bacterium]|nr:PEP-CTERM sorting domain-containing protein [Phycisphaerae bacterium]